MAAVISSSSSGFDQEAYDAFLRENIENGTFILGSTQEGYGSDEEVYFNDGSRFMTNSEVRRYRKQIRETEGFEVEHFPNVIAFGLIRPAPWKREYKFFKDLVDFAIKKKNKRIKFVRIVNVNRQSASPAIYYITFEADDRKGQTRTYQTKVDTRIDRKLTEVDFVRLKPGQSQDYPSSSSQAVVSSSQPMESSYLPMDYEIYE